MPSYFFFAAAAPATASVIASLAAAVSAQPLVDVVGTEEGSCNATMDPRPPFHSYFPPVGADMTTWFRDNVPEIPAADPSVTAEEAEYVSWTAADFIAKRRAGRVTCKAYARALTKRARHLRTMNQFMNWDNDPEWPDRVVEAAAELDAKAAEHGIESLAPLYCLPLPAKGNAQCCFFCLLLFCFASELLMSLPPPSQLPLPPPRPTHLSDTKLSFLRFCARNNGNRGF